MQNFPQVGEIVVCRVYKILDYGVFVELLEYEGLNGFVHISQVSSSWIKNIRNFVKENQVRAAAVISVDSAKKQLDLSFNKVSSGTQREKIEFWKQSKRSQKLLEIFAEKKKSSIETVQKEVAEPLLGSFETLYDAFSAIRMKDPDALGVLSEKWKKTVTEVIEKNIEISKKEVSGVLSVSSTAPNGVEFVRQALLNAKKAAQKDADVEIFYIGSGKYKVKTSAFDFKTAEKALKNSAEAAATFMKSVKGKASFTKN